LQDSISLETLQITPIPEKRTEVADYQSRHVPVLDDVISAINYIKNHDNVITSPQLYFFQSPSKVITPLSGEEGNVKAKGWATKLGSSKLGRQEPLAKSQKKFVLDSSESGSEEVRANTNPNSTEEKTPPSNTAEENFVFSPSDFDPKEHHQATVIQVHT